MKSLMITFIIAFIVFEFLEHVVFPLIWFFKSRNKKSNFGVPGMIGKIVKVKRWGQTEGQVLINGECWKATCEIPLAVGSKAVVHDVEGLMLKLKPYEN